jgi:hypothetical protein
MGDYQTYALQIVPSNVYGTTGRTLLFGYPLNNTWAYETPFGPLCKNHRTYTRSGGCTLLSVVRTYDGGPPDVRYFFGYPLNNTWAYETPFGPLCKNHRTYTRVARRP